MARRGREVRAMTPTMSLLINKLLGAWVLDIRYMDKLECNRDWLIWPMIKVDIVVTIQSESWTM
jgi:hypothetical protein